MISSCAVCLRDEPLVGGMAVYLALARPHQLTPSMSTPDQRLEALGYPLDDVPGPGAIYKPVTICGSVAYVSGAVPVASGTLQSAGKVPSVVDLPSAKRAAALCAANNLRMARQALGSLDAVSRVLRLTGYVNGDSDFTDPHLVINGASELLREVLGSAGVGARSAICAAQLPLGSSVETELIIELNR